MPHLIGRRIFMAGTIASMAGVHRASATPPAAIADGTPIGRGKLLVVHEDASGRIVALDSSSYLEPHPTGPSDVIVVGSYCGTRILAPMFTRGVKAVIATDAGIGKDDAGISGLKHGEGIGVPVATIAAMSAETSNGRSTLLGEISRTNAQARALGVAAGMAAYEAAALLAQAAAGKPIPTPHGTEEVAVVVEETRARTHLGHAGHDRHQRADSERCDLQRRQFQPRVLRRGAAHGGQGRHRQRRRHRQERDGRRGRQAPGRARHPGGVGRDHVGAARRRSEHVE